MASEFERVVVTGMGVASPPGCTLADFWGGLLEGHSGIVEIEDIVFSELAVRIGGLVLGNMVEESFSRKEARRMSRSSQLTLVAASRATSKAGLTQGDLPPSEAGVLIGSSIGGFSASESHFRG